jgi:hypothetical protein
VDNVQIRNRLREIVVPIGVMAELEKQQWMFTAQQS